MSQSLQDIFEKLIVGLTNIFGDNVQQIILYGSVARGDQRADSDIDIAVIIEDFSEEMHDEMVDLTVDLELEYDRVLSVLLIDHNEFKDWEDVLPFYRNVKNEGVCLWKAA